MERTASDLSMVLYSYPPNLGEAGRDEIDGVELIEVDVCFTTSDGRLCKTLLNVCADILYFVAIMYSRKLGDGFNLNSPSFSAKQ